MYAFFIILALILFLPIWPMPRRRSRIPLRVWWGVIFPLLSVLFFVLAMVFIPVILHALTPSPSDVLKEFGHSGH